MASWKYGLRQPGVKAVLLAALLFGASTPLAKTLLGNVGPWMLAGLLYLGSGLGLSLYRGIVRAPALPIPRRERAWLGAAIVAGGIAAPALLMFGLRGMRASDASLLLNAEGVFTTLLAWFVFRENFDRRVLLGMGAIVAGAWALSGPGSHQAVHAGPLFLVLGACAMWALDNNLMRQVSLAEPTRVAALKGLVAGTVNLSIALMLGAAMPPTLVAFAGLAMGGLAYGASLALFVVGLRHLGTARTGAYFSVAPFFGALVAIVFLKEPLSWPIMAAGALMALGVWLHLTEHHSHMHSHQALEHDHEHVHDLHHQHAHESPVPPGTRHRHRHRHALMTHEHAHFPDAHHRHDHPEGE